MLRPRSARLALTVLVGLLGCVPAQPGLDPGSTTPTPAGTGGKAAGESGAGAAGEGGRTGTGGSASGGAASGDAAAGGASGGSGGSTGGAQGTAGASGTGGAAGEPGTGGAPGDAGAEGGAAPAPAAGAKPSAGCGKKDPPSGSRMFMTQGRTTPYIVSLPPAYNAETPYPLAFALHGFGRDHEACRRSDCPNVQMVMGDKAILVFMKSIGAGWETDTRTQNLQYFGELLTAMKNEYCVDENRVLVAGTSSGAAFTNILGCKYGDQLRLVSPVAGPADNVGCKGNPAAIVIHGISDGVARGENARNLYAQRNGCTMTTVPPLAEVRTKISAARAARRGEIACASYQGCMKAPVRWCEHSFGGYDNSTHGWPPPGAQLIWDLMNELK